jgi:hypothetical protein
MDCCVCCGKENPSPGLVVVPIGNKRGGIMCKECADEALGKQKPEMELLTTECYYKECPYHHKDEPIGSCYVKDEKFSSLCRMFRNLCDFKKENKDVNAMVVNSAREIYEAMDKLNNILYRNEDTGDWYGCVSHAIEYLNEALSSNPPGFQDYNPE